MKKTANIIFVVFLLIFVTHHLKAQLCINEFLASNISVNTDPDIGKFADWIEIYNSSGQTVNLEGYCLTDDPADLSKWKFPHGTHIGADSYLLVWADGLDTSLIGIHLNFKLNSFGEQILLIAPDFKILDSIRFTCQIGDISQGRSPAALQKFMYFDVPTPGNSNSPFGFEGISSAPIFSVQGGYYTESQSVEIFSNSKSAEIRFTTDGSIPTMSSLIYTDPIFVNSTDVIRAMCIEPGNYLPSQIETHSYYISETNFEASLPIITINTAGQAISPDYKISAQMAVISSDTAISNEFDGRISIKIRGSSSQMFPKKQYRIEIQTEYGDNYNVPLLGMPEENDWILYAPYSDKTLMRNVLSYKLAGEMGRYAPRTGYCEVFLNGEYIGVYSLIEVIKQDKNRIDIKELYSFDNTEPRISGAYIFKRDRGTELIHTQSGVPLVPHYPDEFDITFQQIAWLQNYLNGFESTLSGSLSEMDNFIDIVSFIDNFLTVEAFKNIDGYRLSTFFYKDRNEKIVAAPVWDYNLSMGNADYLSGWMPEGWYVADIQYVYEDVYWWFDLFMNSAFWNASALRWRDLRQSTLNIDYIYTKVDNYVLELDQASQRNFNKWPILGEYVWPNYFIGETYEDEISFMKQFLLERFMWIDSQFGFSSVPISFDFDQFNTGKILINDIVNIDTTYTGLYLADEPLNLKAVPYPGYRFFKWEFIDIETNMFNLISQGSEWKYLDDGSDQQTDWYQTWFDDDTWASGSAQLGYGDGDEATVVSYGPDPDNKFITTYFRKSFTVDNPSDYEKVLLRLLRDDGAVIYLNGQEIKRSNMPAGEIDYLTFAETTIGGEAENVFYEFEIAAEILTEGENLIAVEIHQANPASSDISFDLELLGVTSQIIGTPFEIFIGEIDTVFTEPKLVKVYFEEINALYTALYINEFMASNNSVYADEYGEYDDWIELYNSTDDPINIAGLFLTDDPAVPNKWQITAGSPDNTVIDANGYIVLWADDSTNQGDLHLNFKLSASGESVGLSQYHNNQFNWLDYLTYGPQTTDISYGRYPDGTDYWTFFNLPTPNAPNFIPVSVDKVKNVCHFDCFPNPFREKTCLKLDINKVQHVYITVFDMSGRIISVITDKEYEQGEHLIVWNPVVNGNQLNQGIYYIKLQTEDFHKTIKVVHLN